MHTIARILFVILAPVSLFADTPARCKTGPMRQQIKEFHARNLRLIEALVQFGQENGICMGIEALDKDLFGLRIDFDVFNVNTAEVIRRILEPSAYLEAEEQDSVVLIRPRIRGPNLGWLDFVIPRFVSSRKDLLFVDSTLKMTFVASADPSVQTMVGSFPGGDPTDLIGPFDDYRKSLRQLLNLLVSSSSKGAMWVVYGDAEPKPNPPKGSFWRIFQYSQDRDGIVRIINALPPTPRPQQ